MSNLLLNTEILSERTSRVELMANLCLAPHRYLFNGRTVIIWDQTVIEEKDSFPQKNWIKTAAAISLWVPALFLGLIAKVITLVFSSATKSNQELFIQFEKNPYPLDHQVSLELSHARLGKMSASIKERMTSKEIWSDQAFIESVSTFMDAAFEEIELFYSQLSERHEGDPEIMADVIREQDFYVSSTGETETSVYAFKYFYDSLTEMYHLARGCAVIKDDPHRKGQYIDFADLEDEDEKPYFESSTAQYKWRNLYNQFCQMLDDNDLRNRIKDTRFANWSQPDNGYIGRYGFPDTRPTPPISVERLKEMQAQYR